MEEELRPAIKEPAVAYGLVSILLWLLVSVAVSFLPVPGFVVSPVVELAAFGAGFFFVFRVGEAFEHHLEERYYVGEGVIKVQWDSAFNPVTVPLQNVDRVRVEMPPLLRAFGVGTVWIYTYDHRGGPLHNIKDARKVAEKIRPSPVLKPVFRPTVG